MESIDGESSFLRAFQRLAPLGGGSLFLLIVILLVVGCDSQRDPEMSSYYIVDNVELPIPEIMLVRRVTPRTQTKKVMIYGNVTATEEIGESRFGEPHEDANPQCIIKGIVNRIPKAQIVPTLRFWDEVAGPLEKVELSILFESPVVEQLHELNIDALVLAHNMEFDLETGFGELILSGGFTEISEETSAAIVINFHSGRIFESTSASGKTEATTAHVMIIMPLIYEITPTSDVCDVIAEHTADAIISEFKSDAPTILVLVTEENPHFQIDTGDNKTQ